MAGPSRTLRGRRRQQSAWPKLGRKRTGGYRTQRGVVTQSGGDVRSNVVKLFTLLLHG